LIDRLKWQALIQFLIVGVVHAADNALAREKQFGNDE